MMYQTIKKRLLFESAVLGAVLAVLIVIILVLDAMSESYTAESTGLKKQLFRYRRRHQCAAKQIR